MKAFQIFFSILFLGFAWTALAADLKAPMELETTQVLPNHVGNPRLKNLFMTIDSRYNGEGIVEPLGNKFNKSVSWQNLIDSQASDLEKTKLKGLLKANNISDAEWKTDGPGSVTGKVNTSIQAKVPVLAFGVTNRLTLALAVPVLKIQASVDTGFDTAKHPSGERFMSSLCEADPVKCNEVNHKLRNAIGMKLAALGYEPLQSKTVSGIGDIKLVGKYKLHQDSVSNFTVKSEVTFPTGIKPNPDQVVDLPTGDGQYDLGAMLIWDYQLREGLKMNAFGGYTAQLPDQIVKRIPTAEDSLSSTKELLKRNLGDVVSCGAGFTYEFPSTGLNIGAGYSFQYLGQTHYKDGQYDSSRYRLLEGDAPLQTLHSATLMAGFSTVGWYQEKKFVYPFQANLAFSQPLSGKNVTKNNVLMAELVLFF